MAICRIIAWFLVLVALAAVGYDLFRWYDTGSYSMAALGVVWFEIDAASLNGAQAAIQRYVSPWLWEAVITEYLRWPAWTAFALPGLALVLVCRRRRRRRFK